MLRAVIRKTLFGQNVSRGNSSNFNDVKFSRSTQYTPLWIGNSLSAPVTRLVSRPQELMMAATVINTAVIFL